MKQRTKTTFTFSAKTLPPSPRVNVVNTSYKRTVLLLLTYYFPSLKERTRHLSFDFIKSTSFLLGFTPLKITTILA